MVRSSKRQRIFALALGIKTKGLTKDGVSRAIASVDPKADEQPVQSLQRRIADDLGYLLSDEDLDEDDEYTRADAAQELWDYLADDDEELERLSPALQKHCFGEVVFFQPELVPANTSSLLLRPIFFLCRAVKKAVMILVVVFLILLLLGLFLAI